MRRVKLLTALVLTAALVGPALAGATATDTAPPRHALDPAPDPAHVALRAAVERLGNNDAGGALPFLQKILADPSFAQFTSDEQHGVLRAATYAELNTGHSGDAEPLAKRLTLMPQADALDWTLALSAALVLHDGAEAGEATTMLARRWPDEFKKLDERAVSYAVELADKVPDRALRLGLLSSLYDDRWPADHFEDHGDTWRKLALLLIEGGDLDRAGEIAANIRIPHVIAAIRFDRRFDAIFGKDPAAFDPQKAVDVFIGERRARAEANPEKLEDQNALAQELVFTGRDQEALAVTDTLLAKANSPAGKAPAFTDKDAQIQWTYDIRARALWDLGRFGEAAEVMATAMQHQRKGGDTISQTVNLGAMLDELGQPSKALAVIAQVGPGSPFGELQAQGVRADAYSQLGDKEKLAKCIDFARTHLKDDPQTLEDMLIESDDLDGAAALYVQRLQDPDMRDQALASLQDWLPPALTPVTKELRHRFEQVRARPEVQEAIKAVGRIETFPFNQYA